MGETGIGEVLPRLRKKSRGGLVQKGESILLHQDPLHPLDDLGVESTDSARETWLLPTFGGTAPDPSAGVIDEVNPPAAPREEQEFAFTRNRLPRQDADRLLVMLDSIFNPAGEGGVEVAAFDN